MHGVERAVELARLAELHVIGGERGAERAAGVAGRRLDPDALELAVAQDLAVGDAVERDAAGQAQVLDAVGAATRSRVMRSMISSVTFCTEAARSMSRWVSGSLSCRARAAEQLRRTCATSS